MEYILGPCTATLYVRPVEPKVWHCPQCEEVFSRRSMLARHFRDDHGGDPRGVRFRVTCR